MQIHDDTVIHVNIIHIYLTSVYIYIYIYLFIYLSVCVYAVLKSRLFYTCNVRGLMYMCNDGRTCWYIESMRPVHFWRIAGH